MNLLMAKVVDVHPEQNTVDVVVAADGRTFPGVHVLSGVMTGQTGLVDLHVPDLTTSRKSEDWVSGKWASLNTDKRDILAVIGFAESVPVCFGFVSPPTCEMNFPAAIGEERRIYRHASDVYEWTDKDGNTQFCHPNGSYATLAEDPDKLDLTAKDYDQKWSIKRNLGRVLHFFFGLINSGSEVFRAWIKPDGDALFRSSKRVRIQVGESGEKVEVDLQDDGSVTIKCLSGLQIESSGAVSITASTVDLVGLVKINGISQSGS